MAANNDLRACELHRVYLNVLDDEGQKIVHRRNHFENLSQEKFWKDISCLIVL